MSTFIQAMGNSLSEEMFRLVERYYQNGLPHKAFCEQEGISVKKLAYWATQYRRYYQKNRMVHACAQFIALQPEKSSKVCEVLPLVY